MIQIDLKYQPLLLEALEELMYKVSLELDSLKGSPLSAHRQQLTKKQQELEKLQQLISHA
ncbi:MAG: hypothetical protein KDC43_11450 [Saprospiraceae bacterium]|nr:hypothetical protein [Saprospiraceae bacterium]MCB0624502.1 hypothetical protein [Saprospiraceae bacterium]MCB0684578.1 hypothetical protein [Saprospiraceae bacterium]